MRKLWLGCYLLSALFLSGCSADSGSADTSGTLVPGIAEIFSQFTTPESPGAVAMVIQDGKVVHAEGYGMAELGSGRALTRETPMRLGSVGKQFTSMAIMILADRGELGFDNPVTAWVPELGRFPGIRVHHLLQHTSGLPDYYDLPDETFAEVAGSDGDPVLTNADVITLYESWGEPLFEPGERYLYSNTGFTLLAVVVERVTGQTLREFTTERIFAPLGMESTHFHDDHQMIVRNRAYAYARIPTECSG